MSSLFKSFDSMLNKNKKEIVHKLLDMNCYDALLEYFNDMVMNSKLYSEKIKALGFIKMIKEVNKERNDFRRIDILLNTIKNGDKLVVLKKLESMKENASIEKKTILEKDIKIIKLFTE